MNSETDNVTKITSNVRDFYKTQAVEQLNRMINLIEKGDLLVTSLTVTNPHEYDEDTNRVTVSKEFSFIMAGIQNR